MVKMILTAAMVIATMGVTASTPKTHDAKHRCNYPVRIWECNDESIMVGKLIRDGFKITTIGEAGVIHTYILQRVSDNAIETIAYTFINKQYESQIISRLDL